MVLTQNQTTEFFTQTAQMSLPAATYAQLQAEEGLSTVDDLAEFDETLLKAVQSNLRRPAGTMVDPNDPTRQIPRTPFVMSAISLHRLTIAAKAVRYYQTVDRTLTAGNMRWATTLKVFEHHITALESKAAKDTSDVPKVSRSLPIGKWSETFSLFLHDSAIGARNIPLAYVIRETVDVPAEAPALLTGKPYSDEHGSVVNELIARASHTHDLFQEDNKLVFCLLEEALRATSYAASLSPFKGRNRFDGRGAWFALIAQFIGKDKWQKELKKQEDLIHSQCWKSNGNILLETFISKHRQGFVSMQRCAEHIDYQLPNERTRVTYLLDAIKTNDPHLSAAIANVKADDGPAGKRSDFEACAAYLLPSDPVAQKRRSNRREDHNISGAATMDLGETRD